MATKTPASPAAGAPPPAAAPPRAAAPPARSPADDFEAYVNALRFRLVGPDFAPSLFRRGMYRFPGIRHRFEWLNTVFPSSPHGTPEALRTVDHVPRMSTLAIGAVIHEAVSRMPGGQAYANVGVWNGYSLLAGMAGNPGQRCIGIDNFSTFGGPREAFLERFERLRSPSHEFHDMDYQAYFARVHRGPLGVYFYDGNHDYDNQLRALEVAEPFLMPGAIVLVDDTNGKDPRQATLDFMAKRPGAYRLILDRTCAYNGQPTWWDGLMVLRKLR